VTVDQWNGAEVQGLLWSHDDMPPPYPSHPVTKQRSSVGLSAAFMHNPPR
jgi:hypothetical protein